MLIFDLTMTGSKRMANTEMFGTWNQAQVAGYEAWIGESMGVSLTVVPALGSKATSLRNRKTGREWLYQPEQRGRKYGNKGYGSIYKFSDRSGWDEMFPTINACNYPEFPWEDVEIPDHGEVWSITWEAQVNNGGLVCRTNGVRLPYSLRKTYRFLSASILRIEYEATNESAEPLSFLWAAHPLLQLRDGMKLLVPPGMDQIVVSYSHNDRLGKPGDICEWPVVHRDGGSITLNIAEPDKGLHAEKYYFRHPATEGWAALLDPGTGEKLTFRYPVDRVPYLAVWANYGGNGGDYNLAIEPATGFLDNLHDAAIHRLTSVIPPHGTYDWFLEVELSREPVG
jgi:galactose mutarotase-like enzyme